MTEFNAGDEFLYYGNNEHMHGNFGKVTRIHCYDPTEYECMVEGIVGPLYLSAKKMQKIHTEPDWEV